MPKRRRRQSKTYTVRHKGKALLVESHLEQAFLRQWLKMFPEFPPETQHMFHDTRKWRFDFYWPVIRLAVEIQGFGPGHTSKKGMYNDANKNNAALSMGIVTVYFTSIHLEKNNIEGTCKGLRYIMSKR